MKKILLTTVALTALVAAPAMAADLRLRAPVYKGAPVVAAYSWTGCYVGGNVGGVWVNKEWFSQLPGDPSFGQSFGSHDANSWLGGVQAGCNYQVGNWVFGIQGDYDWTNASGSNVNAIFPGLTDSSEIKSISSVTGRVGYAWDRFLGYIKGGGAWEKDSYTVVGDPGGGPIIGTGSETRSGWTVGIGGEYAFTNNLTGFVEYDWYGFGTRTVNFAIFDPTGGSPPSVPFSIKESKSVLKVGLNWKFGGPVVARY